MRIGLSTKLVVEGTAPFDRSKKILQNFVYFDVRLLGIDPRHVQDRAKWRAIGWGGTGQNHLKPLLNNNNKRSLFTINLINCTIYLPKGRELNLKKIVTDFI